MKLEVGMYVRTKAGFICKVLKEEYDGLCELNYYILEKSCEWNIRFLYEDMIEKYVVKASHNIIDLVDIGDYVNGYKVKDFDVTYFNGTDRLKEPRKIGVILDIGIYGFEYKIKSEDIKSILTKEQFENMAYRIGDYI